MKTKYDQVLVMLTRLQKKKRIWDVIWEKKVKIIKDLFE